MGSHAERKQSFISKYVFSKDHKVIGIQFLLTSFVSLLIGGALAMAIRWQLAYPWQEVPIIGKWLFPESGGTVTPEFYATLVTMHGTVMIFFVIIPFLVGAFGNFLIPLQIGARDMAFPTLNMLSYWFYVPAFIVAMTGFFVEGNAAAAGWTSYPPLSVINPQGQDFWLISILIVGSSSLMGAVNYVTTIVNMRAPGLGFFRLPMTIWALLITAILILIATPVLTAAGIMLLFDRTMGTCFFIPKGLVISGEPYAHAGGGQPLLWQHLFWFYSHPAVYIMILPAMGIASDIISTFSRKPLFGYRPMVYSICAIAGLGCIVWGHHMFQSGMNPVLGMTFMTSTMLIALPSAIKTFNWLGTLWGGKIHFTSAMCNALAFVSMFVIGGLSGIFMAATNVDIYIHDTYFIVGHIHYVLFGGSMFAIFAGIYYWFPKMFGRAMNEFWGKVHFVLTFIFFNGTFFVFHILGVGGMMRRIADATQYTYLQHLQPLNVFASISSFGLGLVQVIFVLNFFSSLFFGKRAEANHWKANTLEWADTPSPPPHGNFDVIPTVYRGPYEYSSPLVKEDWLPQSRKLAETAGAGRH
ncbi:MAG: cbb3-type cytochrome c oxidase subunit I [Candidatus Omnitrophica bacterium]|nr:cbb3-type cytochrome c oxidase subunit I [Candidatus Omnitrophota bacterium]